MSRGGISHLIEWHIAECPGLCSIFFQTSIWYLKVAIPVFSELNILK